MPAHLEARRITTGKNADLEGALDCWGRRAVLAWTPRLQPHNAVPQTLQRLLHCRRTLRKYGSHSHISVGVSSSNSQIIVAEPLARLHVRLTHRANCSASTLPIEGVRAAFALASFVALLCKLLPHSLLHVRVALREGRPCIARHAKCGEQRISRFRARAARKCCGGGKLAVSQHEGRPLCPTYSLRPFQATERIA